MVVDNVCEFERALNHNNAFPLKMKRPFRFSASISQIRIVDRQKHNGFVKDPRTVL